MRRHKVSLEVQALAWLMSFGAALGSIVGIWTSRVPKQKIPGQGIPGKGISPDKVTPP